MWYSLFFVAILSNIFYNLEWTRISKRTNRIIYETQCNTSNMFLRYFIINAVFILFSPLWLCYFFDLALGDIFKSEREKLMTKQVRTLTSLMTRDKFYNPPHASFHTTS